MSDERVRQVEKEHAKLAATVRAYIAASSKREAQQVKINEKLFDLAERMANTIHGEGGEPGIKGRLDRLETKSAIAQWFAGTALGGMMIHTIRVLMEKN